MKLLPARTERVTYSEESSGSRRMATVRVFRSFRADERRRFAPPSPHSSLTSTDAKIFYGKP